MERTNHTERRRRQGLRWGVVVAAIVALVIVVALDRGSSGAKATTAGPHHAGSALATESETGTTDPLGQGNTGPGTNSGSASGTPTSDGSDGGGLTISGTANMRSTISETTTGGTSSGTSTSKGTPGKGTPGTPVNGTPGTGTPGNGTPVTGTPVTGTPVTGTPVTGTPGNGTPGNGTVTDTPWVVNTLHEVFRWNGSSWGNPLPGTNGNAASVTDVAVGPDGSAWAIGTAHSSLPSGNQILEWNGTDFTPVTGAAVEITVGPGNTPWVVNTLGEVFRWNGTGWGNPLAGTNGNAASVTDVAVGPDGSAWAIGTARSSLPSGNQILEWNGTDFAPVTGAAVEITVGPGNTPWVVNTLGEVFRWNGTGWGNPLAGTNGNAASVTDVAVGPDGSAWAIGTARSSLPSGNQILEWNGTDFTPVTGAAVEIAVGG